MPVGKDWKPEDGVIKVWILLPVGWRSGDGARPRELRGAKYWDPHWGWNLQGCDVLQFDIGKLESTAGGVGMTTQYTITEVAAHAFEMAWADATGEWLCLRQ